MTKSDVRNADVWTEDGFAPDAWSQPVEGEDAHETTLLTIDALEAQSEGRNVPFGLLLRPGDDVTRIVDQARRAALIAVDFPVYGDGRGYSIAALLRDRIGYEGPLRAQGDVLLDQIPYMLRCGFTEFAVTDAPTRKRLATGDLPGTTHHYQPVQRPEVAAGGYAWRRKSA